MKASGVLILIGGGIQEQMDRTEYLRPLGYGVNCRWLNWIWMIQQRRASQGKIAKQGTNGNLKEWNGFERDEGQLRILQKVSKGEKMNDH